MKAVTESQSDKIRVVVFGSFYRGYYVLNELLTGEISKRVVVVGVATDDPSQSYVSAGKRVWQYPHTEADELMVMHLAQAHGLAVYRERVKTPGFYQLMEEQWQPDLCIMATFGQKIDARLFTVPPLGFFNLHPCIDDGWPSRYVGPNPFQALRDEGKNYTQVALHRVDDNFDTGELIAYSEKIPYPHNASVIDMHKIIAPSCAHLTAREIEKIIVKAKLNGYVSGVSKHKVDDLNRADPLLDYAI